MSDWREKRTVRLFAPLCRANQLRSELQPLAFYVAEPNRGASLRGEVTFLPLRTHFDPETTRTAFAACSRLQLPFFRLCQGVSMP